MRDELAEIEGHVDAGLGFAKRLTVQERQQGQVHFRTPPGIAEFVRRNGDRRKGARRLGLKKSETLGEFAGNQLSQRDVVNDHDQLDMAGRVLRADAHRHIARYDGDFGFEINSPVLARRKDRLMRTDERIGTALVHQRVRPETLRHFGATRLAHEFDMIDVSRAVGPLVGAWQR